MATVEEYMDEVLKVKLSEKEAERYQKEWKEENAAKKLKFVQESFKNVSRQNRIKTSEKKQTDQSKEENKSSVPRMVTKKTANTASLQDKILYVDFSDNNKFHYELHRALKVAQTLKNNISYKYNQQKKELDIVESQDSVDSTKEQPIKVEVKEPTVIEQSATLVSTPIVQDSEKREEIEEETSIEKPKKATRNGTRRAKVKKYTALKIHGDDAKEEKFKLVPTASSEKTDSEDEKKQNKASLISEIEREIATPINEPPKYTNSDIFENAPIASNQTENSSKKDTIIIVPERESKPEEKTTEIHFDVSNATSNDLKKATAMTTDIGKLKEYLVRATTLKKETELMKKQAEERKKEAEMQKQQLLETAQKLEEYTRALAENKTRIEQEAQRYSEETEEYNRTMAEMLEAMQPSQDDISTAKTSKRAA